MKPERRFKCVVIGVSSGGMQALSAILPYLKRSFPMSVVVVQHISPHSDNYMTRYLDNICDVTVKEVDEKEKTMPGVVYTAPPNYHVLVEEDYTLSLSVEDRINFARPSVDVLFESAAEVFGETLVGVILTGANNDGSRGLKRIKEKGGLTIVENPETAEVDSMPLAAIAEAEVDHILDLAEIGPFLANLGTRCNLSKQGGRRI